jgi:hypothetical protein
MGTAIAVTVLTVLGILTALIGWLLYVAIRITINLEDSDVN